MTLSLALVADDLTGALDTSAPFVAAGLSVAVAVTPEATARALAAQPDVIAINTASRASTPAEAAARVNRVGAILARQRPGIVLKKIDSRLKGNVCLESATLAGAMGRRRLVVAPAVPDQGRVTSDGFVAGRGVDAPLAVLPQFAQTGLPVEVRDAATDADLDAVVAGTDWNTTLAVGARGLGLAFARSLARGSQPAVPPFRADGATLFAFGSRDPITGGQVAGLIAAHAGVAIVDAPDGRFALPAASALPLVVRCTGQAGGDANAVAARFAGDVAAAVAMLKPSTLVMGGGDTALAILCALGVEVLFPQGEAAAGLPWFTITAPHGAGLRCVVKSGGFGPVGVLSEFLESAADKRAEPYDH